MKLDVEILKNQLKALKEHVDENLNADCDITLYDNGILWLDIHRGDHCTGTGFSLEDDLNAELDFLKR